MMKTVSIRLRRTTATETDALASEGYLRKRNRNVFLVEALKCVVKKHFTF